MSFTQLTYLQNCHNIKNDLIKIVLVFNKKDLRIYQFTITAQNISRIKRFRTYINYIKNYKLYYLLFLKL